MIGDKLIIWYKNRMDSLVCVEQNTPAAISAHLAARHIAASEGILIEDDFGEHFIPAHRILEIEVKESK